MRTLSVDTLRWQGSDLSDLTADERAAVGRHYRKVLDQLKQYADACLYLKNRKELFEETRKRRITLHGLLEKAFAATPKFAIGLGVDPAIPKFEVHELRRAIRVTPDGQYVPQIVVSLTQTVEIKETNDTPAHSFRGGTTVVVDLSPEAVRYRIGKGINNKARRERTAKFRQEIAHDPLRGLLFADDRKEPFAALHAFGDGL